MVHVVHDQEDAAPLGRLNRCRQLRGPGLPALGALTLLPLFPGLQECPLAWQPVQHRHAAVLAHQPRDAGHRAAPERWRRPRRPTAAVQLPAFEEEQAVGSQLLQVSLVGAGSSGGPVGGGVARTEHAVCGHLGTRGRGGGTLSPGRAHQAVLAVWSLLSAATWAPGPLSAAV